VFLIPEALSCAAEWLASAKSIVVSTGAGMSKESGVPTFRDAQDGLWARFDPQELATEAGFRAAPARVSSWYAYRRGRMNACHPHAGHHALVQLQNSLPEVTIVTQNIDGFHQAAGARGVIELHGNIHRAFCIDCQQPGEPAEASESEEAEERDPPRCTRCDGYIRPAVVWFGEELPPHAAEEAWERTARADVLLVVGTSGLVWPAAELPAVARRSGGRVIEINPIPSGVTPFANLFLQGPAGELLPPLVAAVVARAETNS
jgi:NAD-dependent deacetylase